MLGQSTVEYFRPMRSPITIPMRRDHPTWPNLGDGNALDTVEAFFHNVFGSRGSVTTAELGTSTERAKLSALQGKLTAALGSMTGDRLAVAFALSGRVQRHLQTYPETDVEARVWMETALQMEGEIQAVLPRDWMPIALTLGAAGVVAFALWRFFGSRRGY